MIGLSVAKTGRPTCIFASTSGTDTSVDGRRRSVKPPVPCKRQHHQQDPIVSEQGELPAQQEVSTRGCCSQACSSVPSIGHASLRPSPILWCTGCEETLQGSAPGMSPQGVGESVHTCRVIQILGFMLRRWWAYRMRRRPLQPQAAHARVGTGAGLGVTFNPLFAVLQLRPVLLASWAIPPPVASGALVNPPPPGALPLMQVAVRRERLSAFLPGHLAAEAVWAMLVAVPPPPGPGVVSARSPPARSLASGLPECLKPRVDVVHCPPQLLSPTPVVLQSAVGVTKGGGTE